MLKRSRRGTSAAGGRDARRAPHRLDTLGKLHAHGHGLFGYCRRCDRHFDVPLPTLIAARGADSLVVRMMPVRCASCGGRDTEIRITAPSKAGERDAGL